MTCGTCATRSGSTPDELRTTARPYSRSCHNSTLDRSPTRYDSPMNTFAVHAVSPQPTRRWQRYKIDVPVRVISWNDPLQAKITDARRREMSEGGMAVFAGVELRTDAIVEVEFTPAYSGEPLRVSAQVRSREGYYYGLEFLQDTKTGRQQAARLRELLSSATDF